MIKFTNPFTTIKYLKQDLVQAQEDAATAQEALGSSRRMYSELYEDYDSLALINMSHRDLNGKLHADIDNLNDQFFKDQRTLNELTVELQQNEEGLYAHMQEREELKDIIDDLEEESDVADDIIETLVSALDDADAELKMLNELLVEGSAAYDNVVAAGEKAVADAVVGYNQVRAELAALQQNYEIGKADYDTNLAELQALKLANTQSLSWVRQAEEALEAYGIRIEDTPVGPVVQLDTEALVNRVALDNVAGQA